MSSALDGLKGLLEFADRIYVIDQGKNLIWTGSELVEDKNPESGSGSSDEGSGGSGESGTTLYGPYFLIATNGGDGYNVGAGEAVTMEMDKCTDKNNNVMVVPEEPVEILISTWGAGYLDCYIDIYNQTIYTDSGYIVAPEIRAVNHTENSARDVYGSIAFYTIGVELESGGDN